MGLGQAPSCLPVLPLNYTHRPEAQGDGGGDRGGKATERTSAKSGSHGFSSALPLPWGGGAVGKGITLLRPAPLWVPRENNLGLAALQSPGANTCHLKSHPTRW